MIARIAWKTIEGFSVEQDAFIIDHAEITNKVFFQDDIPNCPVIKVTRLSNAFQKDSPKNKVRTNNF